MFVEGADTLDTKLCFLARSLNCAFLCLLCPQVNQNWVMQLRSLFVLVFFMLWQVS